MLKFHSDINIGSLFELEASRGDFTPASCLNEVLKFYSNIAKVLNMLL